MTCREVQDGLRPFLKGQLSATDLFDFHRHLSGCPTCAKNVEQARDAMSLSRSACQDVQDPMPDEVPETLVRAIQITSRHVR
jgi:anti-sigma factor RsiW